MEKDKEAEAPKINFPEVRVTTSREGSDPEPGDYDFEILPRIGETIVLYLKGGQEERYRVDSVEYHFRRGAKPPRHLLRVTEI